MLAELGVASQPTNMSFSVSDGHGGFEWATRGARGLFARPGHVLDPKFHRMLFDLTRFNRDLRRLVGMGARGPSLRRFLDDGGYSDYFVERLIVPQASAVWSADPDQMWSFPAAFFAEFFANHRVLQLRGRPAWRTVSGGSRRYVEALIAPFRDRVHLRTPVRHVLRRPGSVSIGLDGGERALRRGRAGRALRPGAAPARRPHRRRGRGAGRDRIPAKRDRAAHRHRAAAAAPLGPRELELPPDATIGAGRTTVTYDMNRLQSLDADERFLVTLNRSAAIDPARVIRTIDYSHPVFTPDAVAAQGRWAEISGRKRTHFCGAYWRWGFHEDGVWSALRVAEALRRTRPPRRAR